MILIGIDPGVQTGFAVSAGGVIIEIKTFTFWETIDAVLKYHLTQSPIRVYIENPNVNKPIFIKKGASPRGYMRIAQNVGSNKRDAELIIEECQRKNIDYVAMPPLRGSMHKPDSDMFYKITGCKGKTNQHERDAVMLIWGRKY